MSYNSKYTGAEVEALLDKIKNFEGGGGKTAVVYHGTEDTTIELTPNVVHKWDSISSLSLTLPDDEEGYVNHYKVVFTAASDMFTMAVPSALRWVNDEIPSFEANMQYEVSIEGRKILWAKFKEEIEGDYLEYIENDGTDYILTDITIGTDVSGMRYKAMPLFESGSVQYGLVGARASTSKADTPFAMWYLNSSRQLYYNGTSKASFGTYTSGVIYEDEWSEQNTVSISYPISVFGVNTAGSVQYIGHFRFYGLQILNASGKAICDLRPFMKKNGVIGLRDDVSGSFYPSVNGNLTGA